MGRIGAAVLIVAALGLGADRGSAGTIGDPEILDGAGDANLLNGQGVADGMEDGPDTRPGSVGGADLRAAWFETMYETRKVLDPDTGGVARVEYVATGVRLHIRTEQPVYPMQISQPLHYAVTTSVPGCRLRFEFDVKGNGGAGDITRLGRLDTSCPGGFARAAFVGRPISYSGAVATGEYPWSVPHAAVISRGQTLTTPGAYVARPAALQDTWIFIDEAAEGRSFVVGADIPQDVDCAAEPDHADCAA